MRWIGLGMCAFAIAYAGGGPAFMVLIPITYLIIMAD